MLGCSASHRITLVSQTKLGADADVDRAVAETLEGCGAELVRSGYLGAGGLEQGFIDRIAEDFPAAMSRDRPWGAGGKVATGDSSALAPFGMAPGGYDGRLAAIGRQFQANTAFPMGALGRTQPAVPR
jgi:hypothetical protein